MKRTPKELLIGPSGIPRGAEPRDLMNGLEYLKKIGLKHNELAFVHSVFLKKENAPEVKEFITKNDMFLTAHGSYYINLNAAEAQKVGASKGRILQAARVGHEAGIYSLTFHPAYYLKQEPKLVYDKVKKEMKEVVKTLQDEGNDIWIRPETTGKPTQFGNFDELLKLSSELEQVLPCVDFSHIHARNNGGHNSYEEFKELLSKYEKVLGREALDNMHIHLSGIVYGEKGEKHHINLEESDMEFRDLAKVWKEFKIKGCVAIESPSQEDDALLMNKVYSEV
jgi:deoxyribonuclease-4